MSLLVSPPQFKWLEYTGTFNLCRLQCETERYAGSDDEFREPATLWRCLLSSLRQVSQVAEPSKCQASKLGNSFIPRWDSLTAFSSQTWVFVWFSTPIFPFYIMLFMNRLQFYCFADFLNGFLKPAKSMFFFNPPSEGTLNSMHEAKDS